MVKGQYIAVTMQVTCTVGVAISSDSKRALRLGNVLQVLVPPSQPIWTNSLFRKFTSGCSLYELVYLQKSASKTPRVDCGVHYLERKCTFCIVGNKERR